MYMLLNVWNSLPLEVKSGTLYKKLKWCLKIYSDLFIQLSLTDLISTHLVTVGASYCFLEFFENICVKV